MERKVKTVCSPGLWRRHSRRSFPLAVTAPARHHGGQGITPGPRSSWVISISGNLNKKHAGSGGSEFRNSISQKIYRADDRQRSVAPLKIT